MIDDDVCAELDAFLRAQGSLEWVGVFIAASARVTTTGIDNGK